jgi:hypothetical protein
MRILFSSEWQYLGKDGDSFKFGSTRGRENGQHEVTLLSDAKYVNRENNIVVYFSTIQEDGKRLSITLSRATERRIEAGQLDVSLIPDYVMKRVNRAIG